MSQMEALVRVFKSLPAEKQQEVIDFASFLSEKNLDTTEYLLRGEANRDYLEEEEVRTLNDREDLIELPIEDLRQDKLPQA
ncbi:MAG: hypothetical protein SFT81_03255 [Candidatus Caenarcaniphilales bacterium]|nr:hypothetical protein [Candidatus Caenarcaniphilales bacterium]